jgi:outer membrane protein TolC
LYGNDTVNYAASANRFGNPAENGLNKVNTINPTHPILDALDKQSEYYTLSGEAQKRSSLPSINLLGGYAYRGTGISPNGTVSGAWKDGFNNTTNNFLAGIGITWNLTSLHTNRMKGEQLFKEAESTKLLHSQYQQAMQADLSASQAKIIQQYEQLQKTRLAVQQSQDAYNMYLARYKSGLITLSELLQIRILLEQAENAHIEASRDYWVLLAYEAELTADFDFLFNNL